MPTLTVKASKQYKIKISSGLLKTIDQEVSELRNVTSICVVSDTNVYPLYGRQVLEHLQSVGFSVNTFVISAGEDSKNAETFLSLLNHLAVHKMTRTDLIIALGGGVVGDLSGFAASCYLRGIRYMQVPTTLLAAVDSSVGGKTAIDLPAGKNLAGAFWQPCLVLCDIDTLSTLDSDIFRDGCAEIIKYAILYDPALFEELMISGLNFDRESVITRCVQWKRDVVMEDEFDTGCRKKLNLGHTVGHGIEANSNFTISHGQAVSIGMAIVARAAARYNFCSHECCRKIIDILTYFRLPVNTDYSAEELYQYTISDKKRSGDSIHLIVPRDIGHCDTISLPINELKSFIEAGL